MTNHLDDNPLDNKNILFFPSGDINTNKLEEILFKALNQGLRDEDDVEFLERKRVSECDAMIPTYEIQSGKARIIWLKGLYKEITGRDFNNESLFKYNPLYGISVFIFNSKTGEAGIYDMGAKT